MYSRTAKTWDTIVCRSKAGEAQLFGLVYDGGQHLRRWTPTLKQHRPGWGEIGRLNRVKRNIYAKHGC